MKKGTIISLLQESYSSFHSKYPEYEEANLKSFTECDSFFYENLKIANQCCFISEYNNELAGMCSWNPRQYPVGIIGHNCILPTFRNLGLGKERMSIALNMLKEQGFKTAKVSTGLMEFFIPAQKMYTGVGFKEMRHDTINQTPRLYDDIYYEMNI